MRNGRKEMLKKSVLVVAVLLVATSLWAVPGPMDVSKTRHNLSSTSSALIPNNNTYPASNEDEVCIFCHTPHGGTMNTPLWNRPLPAASGFTHYTSARVSAYVSTLPSNRNVNAESLLCMSCHDGTTAMNNIINNSNRTVGGDPDNGMAAMNHIITTGGAIGDIMDPGGVGTQGQSKNLSDDHPISFSYYSAWNHLANAGKLNRADGVLANDPRADGIRLFGADAPGGQRVECSSCHDPHVNHEAATGGNPAYTPFLVAPNTGSALCLSCHIK
ncbi:MAG: cytochrome c3 family protein, partial [Desulfuromonadales bacterium]|nr:cytochrome c3 family protein [Desulfuromonadales bacterium]